MPQKPAGRPQNRPSTGAAARPTQFAKGQSGNPGGRPKGLQELIRKRVGKNGQKLVDFWFVVAFGTDAEVKHALEIPHAPRWQDRMAAAQELADRGFGRPTQAVELDHAGGIVLSWGEPNS